MDGIHQQHTLKVDLGQGHLCMTRGTGQST